MRSMAVAGIVATIIIAVFLLPGSARAVPASQAVHEISQPDGFTFKAVQRGDERGAWIETLDGYAVVNSSGRWNYATKLGTQLIATSHEVGKARAAKGLLIRHAAPEPEALPLTGPKKAPRQEDEMPSGGPSPQYSPGSGGPSMSPMLPQYASAPWLGDDDVVVLLVNFTGNPKVGSQYNEQWYENLLFNQSNSGSMASYYNETSYNQYNLSGTIGTGWMDSSYSMSFYGGDNDPWATPICGSIDNCTYRLICEAMDLADASVDFSSYDKDSDGYVDHLIVVHAGNDQSSSGTSTDIWSVKWSGMSGVCSGAPWDGVDITGGSILAENSPLGTFAHEFGHDLGLPDLYDTSYSSDGIGKWGIMSFGSWLPSNTGTSPAHFTGWSKYKLGWIDPVDVTGTETMNQTVANIEEHNYSSLYMHNISSTEYFLVENRQKIGFDSYIPGDGILVWHVDDSKSNNANRDDPWVKLEEADNNNELYFYAAIGNPLGEATDPFSSTVTGFSACTAPNSKAKNGSKSGFSMTYVSANGTNMTASFNDMTPPSITLPSPTEANLTFVYVNYTFINASLDENASTALLEWDNGTVSNLSMSGSAKNWSRNMTGLNDGTYKYRVWANDSANNWNSTGWRTVYMAERMLIVAESPANRTYDMNTTAFNVTLSRAPNETWFSVDDAYNTTMDNDTSTHFFNDTYGELPDGQHNVTFYANDSDTVLNTTETVFFTVDTTAPDISFASPTPANNSVASSATVTVNVTLSKPPDSAILEWDGTNESMSGSGTAWYVTKTGVSRGNYTYAVYANDSVGRMNVSEGRILTVPLLCPVTITSSETLISNMTQSSSGTACVTFGADDITLDCAGHVITGLGSGYGVHALGRDNVTVQNCTITNFSADVLFQETNSSQVINVTARNSSTGGIWLNYSWDNAVRNSSLVSNDVGSLGVGLYVTYGGRNNMTSCNMSLNDYGISVSYSVGNVIGGNEIVSNTEGGVDLYNTSLSRVHDNVISGHAGGSVNTGIRLWSISASNTVWNNTITGNALDGVNVTGGSTGNVFYWNTLAGNIVFNAESIAGNHFNATVSGVAQGNYWEDIMALAVYDTDGDGFGDSGSQYPYSSANGANVGLNVVDWGPGGSLTVPDLSLESPQSTTYGPAVYFNLTMSEAGSWCGYSLDGSANVTTTNDTATHFWGINTSMTDGQHSVVFHCNSTSNVMNESQSVSFTVDALPPSIVLAGPTPSNGSTVSVDYVYVNVTLTESADSAVLEWDGVNETLDGSGTGWHKNKTGLVNANHSFTVYANDTYNNLNSSGNITVTVSAPPTITLESPQNQSYGSGFVYFNITVNMPLDNATFSVDGGVNNSMLNDTLYHFYNLSYPTVSSGQHNVTFYANDSTGSSGSRTVWFTVDTAPPYFQGHQRSPSLPNEDQGVEANVTVGDQLSGISDVTLEWNGTANYTVQSCSGSEYCLTISVGNLTPHENTTYYWYANDSAGNLNMSGQQEFIVDNQMPVPTSINITPDDGFLNRTSGNLTGSWAFTDSDTGDNETNNETKWYLNGSEQASLENATWIHSGNTSKDDTWIFSARVFDGYNWSSWVNSTGLSILNTPPGTPSLVAPANDTNASTANVTFSFSSSEDDGDSPTYYIYINGTLNTSTSSNSAEINFTDGHYTWHMVAGDGQANSSNSSISHFRVDTTAPSVSSPGVFPSPVLAGDNTSVSASVTDLTGVSYVSYNISNSTWSVKGGMGLLSGSIYNGTLNTSGMAAGNYLVLVYANDTLNTNRSVSAGTLSISELTTINVSVLDRGSNSTNTTRIRVRYNGTSSDLNQSSENVTGFWSSVAGGHWDIFIEAGNFNVTFRNVNSTGNLTGNVTIDSNITGLSSPSGVLTILNTIATSASFNFTGVHIELPFNSSLFVNSSRATVYKCSTWNFTTQSCPGGWTNVTGNSTINTTSNITTVNVSSLSAFMITETFSCGDGVLDPGEGCDDGNTNSGDGCSSSCSVETSTTPPGDGGGGGGGGAAAPAPAQPNETQDAAPPVAFCTAGEKRCVGNNLQTCKSDGSAWEVLEECEYGCDRNTLSCSPEPAAPATSGPEETAGEEAEAFDPTLYIIGGILLVMMIGGAGLFLIKRRPGTKPRKRARLASVSEHVPPLKEKAKAPPVPAKVTPPPKPELQKPVHATVRAIQLNPSEYRNRLVRIHGRLHFSHRQHIMDGRKWHMFVDETGRIPATDHAVFFGKGEVIAMVEETKTGQVYLRVTEFRKN